MKGKKLLLVALFILGTWGVVMAHCSTCEPSTYMEAATRVINENNRIDAEIADVEKNANVTLRPYHVIERLSQVNKDAYAIWPCLFVKEVPDKYSGFYINLKKLIKLQMKRTCLIYDWYYYGWMDDNQQKADSFKEEAMRIEEQYFKQKDLVEEAYNKLK